MNTEETKALATGTLLLIAYGSKGTQIARVRTVTRTGKVEVDRFVSGQDVWHASKGSIKPDQIISIAPEFGDPRVPAARICTRIVSAR